MRNTAVNETRSAGLVRPVHVTARGVTLIEVLVAVLVISIGLLGLAALQVAALQANETSYQRSQATNLAYDVIDRMRTNRTDALGGNYDTNFTAAPDCAIPSAGSDLAETDLNEWRMALACGLPNGEGFIDVDTNPAGSGNNLVTVTIRWTDRDAENAGDWESFTTRTEL